MGVCAGPIILDILYYTAQERLARSRYHVNLLCSSSIKQGILELSYSEILLISVRVILDIDLSFRASTYSSMNI